MIEILLRSLVSEQALFGALVTKTTHALDKGNFLSSSERFRTRRYHLNGYCQVNRRRIFMSLYYQTRYETTGHLINGAVMNQHPLVSPKRTNDKRLGD